MADASISPPKQARSRATLDRLMRAAEQVIAERGVAGLTVQEVAERAGVAVGTLYGRFANKDAFLEAFARDFFERARAVGERAFAAERCVGLDARGLVERVVRLLVGSYRAHRGLLRALYLYARARPGGPFPSQGAAFDAELVQRLTALFLERRGELGCPRPERAVLVGLLMVDGAAKDAVLFGESRRGPLAVGDDELIAELAAAWSAYLGIGSSG